MKILHISAECYPVAKVGGLSDVVGALPKYQNSPTVVSQVIIPFYDTDFNRSHSFISRYKSKGKLGSTSFNYEIKTLKNNTLGFELFLVDIPELLFKKEIYSEDDTKRFLAFQIAVLDWVLRLKKKPTVMHCHDHHTGLIPFMMTRAFVYKSLQSIPTIITIHNAQYQGWFSYKELHLIPKFDFQHIGLLDWDGCINPLATAIKCAWRVTTVSPGYMEELKVSANGLEHLLQHESSKCMGILNGIDTEVWAPETDPYLIKNYNSNTVQSGRKANKKWLCKQFVLDPNKPLFAFIGRLVGEKGADLLPEVFKEMLLENKVSVLLLGSGHKVLEEEFNKMKNNYRYVGSYNAFIGYDEKLAHIIYAGADFLLMPSRVEPCGLNQLYALRYGSIPIVRSIGGLKDTVIDISRKNGFGICHNKTAGMAIVKAIRRGITLYENPLKYKKIRNQIMRIDHSWNASAVAYINLYKSLKS